MIKKAVPLLLALFALASCGPEELASSSSDAVSSPEASSTSQWNPEEEGYTRAEIYETTGSKSKVMQRGSDIELEPYEMGGTEIVVDGSTGRELLGMGAALTHSSAYLLMEADEATRKEILTSLFQDGGLSVVRIPIGTSDYTLPSEDFYSLDDMEGAKDYQMEHLSLEKDRRFLIPALKEILAINPNITIFAAPWSAPAWMKTSESLIGGELIGGSETDLAKTSNEEKAYALYLYKVVEAYAAEGIDIDYLSIVNEPLVGQVNYPYMRMTSESYYRVAKELCRRLDDGAFPNLRLDIYDHNVGSMMDLTFESYADLLLSDEDAAKWVGGFALHCYDGNWPTAYADFLYNYLQSGDYPEYSDRSFFLTEVTESSSSVDFAQNLSWAASNVTIGPMGYGASAALYWNLALTSDGNPVKGNNATCYGVVSLDGDEFSYSAAYYALTHVSRFAKEVDGVKPEILSVASSNEGIVKATGYMNASGETVVAVVNVSDRTHETAKVVVGNQMASIELDPQSVTTLVFRGGDSEKFSSIEPTHVDIFQTGVEKYRFEVSFAEDFDQLSFTASESLSSVEGSEIVPEKDGSKFVFDLSRPAGDFYLGISDGTNSGRVSISLPLMNPSIKVLDGDSYIVEAKFGLDGGTSWSSICDPTGKRIYRSSSETFDGSAELVNVLEDGSQDNIYITTEEYADQHADPEKSNYFFVMDSKAGLVTFHSGAVTFREKVFANEKIDLEVAEGKAYLVYRADGLSADADASALLLKDVNGESHVVTNAAGNAVEIRFDLSLLEKRGVWYDLFVLRGNGGGSFEFTTDMCVDFAKKVEANGIRYGFEQWENVVKVNAVSL